jgi:hypothetical protein
MQLNPAAFSFPTYARPNSIFSPPPSGDSPDQYLAADGDEQAPVNLQSMLNLTRGGDIGADLDQLDRGGNGPFHGRPATYSADPAKDEKRLQIDVPAAAQEMTDDVNSPSAKSLGKGTMTLRQGESVPYQTTEGPAGTRRYSMTFPDGRKLDVLTDPSMKNDPDLLKTLRNVGDAALRIPRSQPIHMSDERKKEFNKTPNSVYLLPSLGVKEKGAGVDILPSLKVGDGVALALDQHPDEDALRHNMQVATTDLDDYSHAPTPSTDTADKVPIDKPQGKQAWPANVQVFAGARQGETLPTHTQFLKHAEDALKDGAPSFPAALAPMDGEELRDVDDDGLDMAYHPTASSNFGKGWKVGEDKPREVLILRAENQPDQEEVNSQIASLKTTLQEKYPGVKFLEPEIHNPEDVHKALQQMGQFAKDNPGAESMTFYIGHGAADSQDPRAPASRVNGGQEGELAVSNPPLGPDGKPISLTGGCVSETQLKQWFQESMGGFDNNLLLLFTCQGGSFVA